MKIMGAVAGLPTPAADWAQTDPERADFIHNKPDVEAIRFLAAEGKALAEEALPRAGGTVTGDIAMGGNRVTGLGVPVGLEDAATKDYVDRKRITKTATITSHWRGSNAPYTQSIPVSGILPIDMPHISPVYSSDISTAISQKEAWACVSKAETSDGVITFSCFEEKPTVSIPIQIEVMR